MLAINYMTTIRYREEEKMQRWNEIKIRQHRLKAEVEQQIAPNPAHIENIMRSGFSMTDIKGTSMLRIIKEISSNMRRITLIVCFFKDCIVTTLRMLWNLMKS